MNLFLSFRELLPPFVSDEFDQILARIGAVFRKEHRSDGTHTDITARSLTLTKNLDTGATGNLSATGLAHTLRGLLEVLRSGTTVGLVRVHASDFTGAELGQLSMNTFTGPAVKIGQWALLYSESGPDTRDLLFIDDENANNTWLARLIWDSANTRYRFEPQSTETLWLGDDAAGRRISQINAIVLFLAGELDARAKVSFSGAISPASMGTSENDYAPTGHATTYAFRLTPHAANTTITGLAGGTIGRHVLLINLGSAQIVFSGEDIGSSAANRFKTTRTILSGQAVGAWYDNTASRWQLIDF